MVVKISELTSNNPPGKLADAELHFTDGPLAGLKLIGFAIWERRGGHGCNVTFPARSYTVNGERRTFALLRPIDDITQQERIRTLILDAWDAHQHPQPTLTVSPAAQATIERLAQSLTKTGDDF